MERGGKHTGGQPRTLRLGTRRGLGAGDWHALQHRRHLLGGQGGHHLDAVAGFRGMGSGGDENVPFPGVACFLVDNGERPGGIVG